jgi:F-type H+-transporting ATPase subunit gamma
MASLKEMRNRISSIKSIQKITKALQMVAAAKLRGATDAAVRAQPYARRMANVIANLSASVSGPNAPLLLGGTGSDQRHLVVVATGDRGLAGGFNSGIAKAAREHIKGLLAQGKDVKIIAVGRKGRDALRRLYGARFVETYDLSAHKKFNLDVVQPIADKIISLYEGGEIDVVTLFYSRFVSVVSQVPTAKQLIPAVVDPNADFGPAPDLKGGVYTYEPDEETILEALLPRNIAVQLLLAVLENQAGFYAAQMAAMDNATRNAGDLIGRYTLEYNRSRQAQITKELIEIISGAEAL